MVLFDTVMQNRFNKSLAFWWVVTIQLAHPSKLSNVGILCSLSYRDAHQYYMFCFVKLMLFQLKCIYSQLFRSTKFTLIFHIMKIRVITESILHFTCSLYVYGKQQHLTWIYSFQNIAYLCRQFPFHHHNKILINNVCYIQI